MIFHRIVTLIKIKKMGSEFSACCISSPLPKKSINQDDQDDVSLDIDTLDNETHFEDLSHLVYDLVSEDKYDVLQQLINNNVIDITTIHWKVS